MTSDVSFKIDTKLKTEVMRKAQKAGLSFVSVLKLAAQAYVEGSWDVEKSAVEKLNTKTRRELSAISKDIKQGKNLSPGFSDVKKASAYLRSL